MKATHISAEVSMTDIILRNLDPAIVDAIQSLADRNHRTLEAEIESTLVHTAGALRADLMERLRLNRLKQFNNYGNAPDSTQIIREQRDNW